MKRPPQLGDLLVSVGVVSKQQLTQALQYQREHGGMVGQILVQQGACTEEDIHGALNAQQRNTPLAQRLAVIKGREAASAPASAPALEAVWRSLQMHEREMSRISRDVQDVSQLLGEMALQVEVTRRSLSTNPEKADEALGAIWNRLRLIIKELDYYTIDLSPSSLNEGALLTSLKQYASHYRKAYCGSLELVLRSDNLRTSPQTALGMFRAIQSILRGLGSSEGCRNVVVSLAVEEEELVVEVAFDHIRSASGATGDPVGEFEERVALLGGSMTRTDNEDSGQVILVARVPVGAVPPARPGSFLIS